MSSSLFYYGDYESYPFTSYIDNDKKFIDLKKGDTIYYCSDYGDLHEIIVNGEMKEKNGHLYLVIKSFNKCKYINFGPTNCANVLWAKNNSIVEYFNGAIGTNKYSVIQNRLEKSIEEFNIINNRLKLQSKCIEKIKQLNGDCSSVG